MKLRFNSKIALFYPGGFARIQELEALLKKSKVELRMVEQDALGLSVAALAGYVDVPQPGRTFEGQPPKASCLVLSGLTEEVLNRLLDSIKEAGMELDYKAVMTGTNRNWAFGALMQEMEAEKAEQKTEEKAE